MKLGEHFDEQVLTLHDNDADTPHHTFFDIIQMKTNGREETIFKLYREQAMDYMMGRVTEIDIQEGTPTPTRASARRTDTEDEVKEKTAKTLMRCTMSKARSWMADMKKWKTGGKAVNRLYHMAYIGPARVVVPVNSTPGTMKTEVKLHWKALRKLLEKQNAKQKADIAKLQAELQAIPTVQGEVPSWVPELKTKFEVVKVELDNAKTDLGASKAEASRLQKQIFVLKEDMCHLKDEHKDAEAKLRERLNEVQVSRAMLEGQLMGLKGRFDNESPARKRQRTGSSGRADPSRDPSETEPPRSTTPGNAF